MGLLAIGAVVAATVAMPSSSLATTGPTPLAFPPRFKVTRAQAAPYLGRFKLAQPLGPKLIAGAYLGGHNEKGFVEGNLVVYAYDAEGRESSWLGRTYEYHAVGGEMIVDVISQANEEIFARMRLHPVSGGRLAGSLKMRIPPGPSQRITLAPLSFRTSKKARPEPQGTTGPEPTSVAPSSADALAGVVAVARRLSPF